MSRIPELPLDEWDPELRQSFNPETASAVETKARGIMAHAPHMSNANTVFMTTAMQDRVLPRRLIELVRLRIAFHNQCRSCMAMRFQSAVDDGLTEDMVCSLEKPVDAPNLSDREKAAIEYADIFSTNHFAIDEDTFDHLRQHFSDAEIVELGIFVGYFVGYGRFMACLDIVEGLPEAYQDKSTKVGPWQSDESAIVQG